MRCLAKIFHENEKYTSLIYSSSFSLWYTMWLNMRIVMFSLDELDTFILWIVFVWILSCTVIILKWQLTQLIPTAWAGSTAEWTVWVSKHLAKEFSQRDHHIHLLYWRIIVFSFIVQSVILNAEHKVLHRLIRQLYFEHCFCSHLIMYRHYFEMATYATNICSLDRQ